MATNEEQSMSATTSDQQQSTSTAKSDQEQSTSKTLLDNVEDQLFAIVPRCTGQDEFSRLCARAQVAAALGWNPTDDWAVFCLVMGETPLPDGVMRRGA
jgi:hypothetical protein